MHQSFKPLFGPGRFIADEAQHAPLQANARDKLHGLFARVDAQLEGRDWLTGTRSITDSYLFVMLRWADGKQVGLAGMDQLRRFFERMKTDLGVQAALQAEGL